MKAGLIAIPGIAAVFIAALFAGFIAAATAQDVKRGIEQVTGDV